MIYLALFAVMQFGLIVYLQREHEKHLELAKDIARCGSPDLSTMVELVESLCQRIQAPEVAVMAHANGTLGADMPMHVPLDDDDEHWVAKEELADRAFREELGGRR